MKRRGLEEHHQWRAGKESAKNALTAICGHHQVGEMVEDEGEVRCLQYRVPSDNRQGYE